MNRNLPPRRMSLFIISLTITHLVACQPRAQSATDQPLERNPGSDTERAQLTLNQLPPLAALPVPTSQPGDDTNDRAREQIALAWELLREDRYTEAAQKLDRALRYSPNSLEAHLLQGRVGLAAGNPTRAEQHLQAALAIDPQHLPTLMLLGRADLELNQPAAALNYLRRAFALSPAQPAAGAQALIRYYLAQALAQEGYTTASVEIYSRYLELLPSLVKAPEDDPDRRLAQNYQLPALQAMAEQLLLLKRFPAAAQALDAAVQLDPENLPLRQKLIELYRTSKNYEAARQLARELAQRSGTGWELLHDIHQEAGTLPAYLADLQELQTHWPQNYQLALAIATQHLLAQQPVEAQRCWEVFLQNNPRHPQAVVQLTEILQQQQRWSEALQILAQALQPQASNRALLEPWLESLAAAKQEQATLDQALPLLKREPADPAVALLIAWLALKLDNLPVVQQALAVCHVIEPPYYDSKVLAAELAIRQYRWAEAVKILQEATAGESTDAYALRLLGDAQRELNQKDAAVEAYNQALRIDRQDLVTMLRLAELYQATDKMLQAKRQYQMILEQDADHGPALEALFMFAVGERDAATAEQYLSRLQQNSAEAARAKRCTALMQLARDGNFETFFKSMRAGLEEFPDDIDFRVQLLRQAFTAGQVDILREEIPNLLARQPDHEVGLQLQAWLFEQELNFQSAIDIYDGLQQRFPYRLEYQHLLINTLLNDFRFNSAVEKIAEFAARPEISSDNRRLFRYDLMMALVLNDQIPDATSKLREWLAEEPDQTTYRSTLITLLQMQELYTAAILEAEQWYRQSVLDQRGSTRLLLIDAYWGAKWYADAAVVILSWLEIDPENVDATRTLIENFELADQLPSAIDLARSSVMDREHGADYENLLVGLYSQAGEYDEAIRLVRKQMDDLNPAPQGMLNGMGEQLAPYRHRLCSLLITAGRYDQAERELISWLNENPANINIRRAVVELLSLTYQLDNQEALALHQSEELYQLSPANPGINNDLGYLWATRGMNLDQAEKMIRLALASDPRSAAFLDSLGWVKYKQGDFEEAWKWLQRAAHAPQFQGEQYWYNWLAARDPRRGDADPIILDHLGDTAWRKGLKEEAVQFWQRAVKQAESNEDPLLTPEFIRLQATTPIKVENVHKGLEPPVAEMGSAVTATKG
ncbi:MAG: Beta-barrel assembly-enhancing protease [Phycisphaerae bacterium]|nr:Beta-barrel assembly-enhancing protease [Phycisphaerae bacterium]